MWPQMIGTVIALLVTAVAGPALAQIATTVPNPIAGAKPVTIERIKVHAPAIEGTLEGETADRDVVGGANAPLDFVDQYIGNLRRYSAISIDVGDQDGLRFDAQKMHEVLDSYGIINAFEIYPGTHISAVAVRFQNDVLPFFSRNLQFATRR